MNTRTLQLLLATSVLLNVLVLGGIGGGLWWAWRQPEVRAVVAQPAQAAQPAQQRGLRFAADALPSAQRQAFRNGLRETRREAAALIGTSREGRAEVARLIAAPQFDLASVRATLQRTREADIALRARIEDKVAEFAATLEPAERVTFAEGLSTQGPLRVPPAARP